MLFFGGGANAADPGLLTVLVVDSAVDALELTPDLTELAVELSWECVFRFSFTQLSVSYRVSHLVGNNLPLTWISDVPPSCPGNR